MRQKYSWRGAIKNLIKVPLSISTQGHLNKKTWHNISDVNTFCLPLLASTSAHLG